MVFSATAVAKVSSPAAHLDGLTFKLKLSRNELRIWDKGLRRIFNKHEPLVRLAVDLDKILFVHGTIIMLGVRRLDLETKNAVKRVKIFHVLFQLAFDAGGADGTGGIV